MKVTHTVRSFIALIIIFCVLLVQQPTAAQDNDLFSYLQQNEDTQIFANLINVSGVSTFYTEETLTVFVPTDAAFNNLPAGLLNIIAEDPDVLQRILYYHTLVGPFSTDQILGFGGAARTFSGDDLLFGDGSDGDTLVINFDAIVTTPNINTANGRIHLIDTVLAPAASTLIQQTATYMDVAAPSVSVEESTDAPAIATTAPIPTTIAESVGPINLPSAPPPQNIELTDPNNNPAFVSGGRIPYWRGIYTDSSICKGMTWTLIHQIEGVTHIGSDRLTNPYRGDTTCDKSLPMLCFQRTQDRIPDVRFTPWAFGNVAITVPIQGTTMTSLDRANEICEQQLGTGWKVAEFHQGNLGRLSGRESGWDFWAYGGLATNTRFWVYIADQPANPWNSIQPLGLDDYQEGPRINRPSQNPAYEGSELLLEKDAGERDSCAGMTWVVLRQRRGVVQPGADSITNPYHGDTECEERIPMLCIQVDGLVAPEGDTYREGWSGGQVKLTPPVTGFEVSNRTATTNICQTNFGPGWRIAEFHDGNLGYSLGYGSPSHGWSFWAYGGLEVGSRFWVAINDRPANPWNAFGDGLE